MNNIRKLITCVGIASALVTSPAPTEFFNFKKGSEVLVWAKETSSRVQSEANKNEFEIPPLVKSESELLVLGLSDEYSAVKIIFEHFKSGGTFGLVEQYDSLSNGTVSRTPSVVCEKKGGDCNEMSWFMVKTLNHIKKLRNFNFSARMVIMRDSNMLYSHVCVAIIGCDIPWLVRKLKTINDAKYGQIILLDPTKDIFGVKADEYKIVETDEDEIALHYADSAGNYLLNGNSDEGFKSASKSLQIKNNSLAHFWLGQYYKGCTLFDKAKEHFKQANKLNPGWTEPLSLLTEVSLETNDLGEAEKYAELALKISPQNKEVRAYLDKARNRKKSDNLASK